MLRGRASCGAAFVFTLIAVSAHAQTYSAPKTPWGDPDLQGVWSGDSAFGIPMQRPESFGTRAELNDKEYAEKVARDERTRKNALSAVGSFRNDNGWAHELVGGWVVGSWWQRKGTTNHQPLTTNHPESLGQLN
jgi:hypothetical protein